MTTEIDMATLLHDEVRVTLSVDTHEDVHVAVVLDQLGRCLVSVRSQQTPPVRSDWWTGLHLRRHRQDRHRGIRQLRCGTGPLAGRQGLAIVEVNRPDHKMRRHDKSDAIDAEAAARAVQSGCVTAVPKAGDGLI